MDKKIFLNINADDKAKEVNYFGFLKLKEAINEISKESEIQLEFCLANV